MSDKPAGPYSIGHDNWNGLSKLIEEAGETIQVAGKLVGSSGEESHWDGTNLRVRLEDELADLMAACQFVILRNRLDQDRIAKRSANKRELFHRWDQGARRSTSPPLTDTDSGERT